MCVGIQKDTCRLGLYICGTGLGFATMANKYWGIRAAHASDCYTAQRARLSLNAQILCMGSRVVSLEYAKMIVDSFLDKPFDYGRKSSVENLQMFKEHEEKILGREKPDYVAWSMGYYDDENGGEEA
jgi:ribose 5-phosphate isomerase B